MRCTLTVLFVLCAVPAAAHEGAPIQLQRMPFEDRVETLFDRAQDYRNLGRVEDALVMFDLVEAIEPNNRRVWFERGRLESRRGHHDLAVTAFTRFLDSGAPSYTALLLRGRSYRALENPTAAIRDLRAAVAVHPGPDAYLDLTAVLDANDRIDEARHAADEGVLRTNADALRERAFEIHLRGGAPDDALEVIAPVIERAAVKTRWLLLRARAHESNGELTRASADRRAALDEAERLLVKRPTAIALAARGEALAALGREGEAADDLVEALRRAPRMKRARELLRRLRGAR